MAAPFQRLLVFDLIPKSFLKFLSHQFLVKFIFQCPISTLKLMKACLRYPILPEFVVETILKHSRLVFRRAEISCHCRWQCSYFCPFYFLHSSCLYRIMLHTVSANCLEVKGFPSVCGERKQEKEKLLTVCCAYKCRTSFCKMNAPNLVICAVLSKQGRPLYIFKYSG